MNRIIKKAAAGVLCAVLACAASVCAFAAETYDETAGIEIINEPYYLKDDKIMVKSFNFDSNNVSGVTYTSTKDNKKYTVNFNKISGIPKTVSLPKGEEFIQYVFCDNSGSTSSDNVSFGKTGGKYVKVRVKLYNIAPHIFNKNGTTTEECYSKLTHTFNYRYQRISDEEYYASLLYFKSGGFITACVPDKNGYAEFYISTNIGTKTEYGTKYQYEKGSISGSAGGYHGSIYQLTFGDINLDCEIDIKDATMIMKNVVGLLNLNKLQSFYADTNLDGKITIADATYMLKYVVGLTK